ncbi:MAG: DNA polymerase I [Planctomycetota bacterium]
MADPKRFYLIDGYAQFFRAFHAIRTPMSSPVTKEPTNATFGFVGMLLKVLRECDPSYLVVAIDVSGDTEGLRNEIYPEYKANRDEPPEGLFVQIDRCIALLKAIGVPVIGVERYEADDVIATICDAVADEGVLTRIVSKDKDLQQLLREGAVEMHDVHTDALVTEQVLMEEKGIAPAQVRDMLALMGDTVDNVPGVPGIGVKTAAKLIADFETLDALVQEAQKEKGAIKGKRQENIVASVDQLGMSLDLVTLRHDAPIEFAFEEASVEKFELAKLMPILKELGFNRYQDELKGLIGDEGASEASNERLGDGFGGLFEQAAADSGQVTASAEGYTLVRTAAELDEMIDALRAAKLIAFDTETTGLEATQCGLVGLSFAAADGEDGTRAWYVPVRSPEPKTHLDEAAVLNSLRGVLEDESVPKTAHNVKFDQLVLRNAPFEEQGGSRVDPILVRGVVFDSMVASYLVDAARSSHSMDALALALLGHQCISIKDLIGTGKSQKGFDEVPLEQAFVYACEDAEITLRLYGVLEKQLREMGLGELFDGVELPLVSVLAELEHNGIQVEPDELDRQAGRLSERIEELRREIDDASPRAFNPDSPKQLAGVLFNKVDDEEVGLGIKPLKKTKTGYSTDVETLEKLAADPEVESNLPSLIVEYRQLTKLVSTYLVALKDAISARDGRIHASFNQTVAATGRLSSSDPNLQNIPIRTEVGRLIRKAFVAPEGRVLVAADYSQIELRMLAHLSQDQALIEAFERGEDIHRAVAAQIHEVKADEVTREMREGAKMVNFGIVYGITAFGLARRLGVSNGEAAEIIDGYRARFPGITTFLQECVEQAKERGYVETILKRRRPIDGIDSKNPSRRALAERMAINSVVQGSAADLIKVAMVKLQASIDASQEAFRSALMLLQIHDELVLECDENDAQAVSEALMLGMEAAMELRVPLRVEVSVGRDWFEAK